VKTYLCYEIFTDELWSKRLVTKQKYVQFNEVSEWEVKFDLNEKLKIKLTKVML
jgi:hypothetical protein